METIHQQFEQALLLHQQGNYNNCLDLLNILLPIYWQNQEWETSAMLFHHLLECKYHTAAYQEALALWQQTSPILQTHLAEASHIWAGLYNVAGNIYGMLGNSKEQIKAYQKALAVVYEKDKPNLYGNIGWIYLNNKDYTKALDYLLLAYTLLEQQNKPIAKLSVINIIAATLRQLNKLSQALEYYKEGEAIAQTLPRDGNIPLLAEFYQNIAKCYFELKNYAVALTHYQTALTYYGQMPQKSKAALYHNLGDIYLEEGQLEQAERYYEQAIYEAQRVYGNKHTSTAHQYRTLGTFYAQQKNYPKALEYYQNAVHCASTTFSNASPQNNPTLNDVLWHYRLLEAIEGKAIVFEQLSQHPAEQQDSITYLQYALNAYLLANELIDHLRHNFKAEGSKLNFAEYSAKIYGQALNVAFKLHHCQLPKALDHAFMFSEKAKAMILLEKIEDSKAKITAQIPQELLDKEQQLLQQMAYLHRKLQQKPNNLSFRNTYFETQKQHEQLLTQFKDNYPHYYQFQHDSQTVTITQLQQQINNPQTAIIEYCLTDTHLHIWVITQQNCYVVSQTKPDLQHLVKQWQKAVKTMNLKLYISAATTLYNILLKPIEQLLINTAELFIIPEAELLYLPFQGLLNNQLPEPANYKNLPYLLYDYAICYHYSATLLYTQTPMPNTISNPLNSYDFWGIAPIKYANIDNMKDLSDAQLEVQEVAQLFIDHNKTAHTAFHHNASLAAFKEKAKHYRYLLLSTHACYENETAEQTRIVFSPFDEANKTHTKQTDYCLFVNDAYNLSLQADLLVLSACESGLGELISGEGMMNLNRGFLYAGTNSLIYTLEKVPARHTRLLIAELFKQIIANKTYRHALQTAQSLLAQTGQPPANWVFFNLICQLK